MELLLITARWPLTSISEFLEDEIVHLAKTFDRVTVAPMRPTSQRSSHVPTGVHVDSSLADHLTHFRSYSHLHSRATVALSRAIQPNPVLSAFDAEVPPAEDVINTKWLKAYLLGRADSRSVSLWARQRPAPDMAYTFWLDAATAGLRAAWGDTPIVSRAHGGDAFSEQRGWSTIPYQRAALEACTLVASVSHNGADYLMAKFPDLGDRIVVRTLGIQDLGGVAQVDEGPPWKLLSVSSVDANKRVDLIARAAAHLAADGSPVTWTHFGSGPDLDALQALVTQLPSGLSVNLREQVPAEDVHLDLMTGGYHAFLNLSLSEGAPVSLMEAQCAGLPVVATAVGGTPEVCPPDLNELVSTQDGVAVIASAIRRAVQRSDAQRGRRREYWSRHYDQAVTYRQWAAELAEMASAPV